MTIIDRSRCLPPYWLTKHHTPSQQTHKYTNKHQRTPTVPDVALGWFLNAAKGLLNHWSNVSTDEKIVGSRKFSKAHSSGRLFCRGVPVEKSVCKCVRVCGLVRVRACVCISRRDKIKGEEKKRE